MTRCTLAAILMLTACGTDAGDEETSDTTVDSDGGMTDDPSSGGGTNGDTAEASTSDGGSGDSTTGDASTGDGDGDGDSGTPDCEEVPSERGALEAWLEQETYTAFAAESGPHESDGPHFGAVRTFVNSCMAASLDAGNAEHPLGSASIKELFGTGDAVQGYSVMVKVAPGTSEGWYWYEGFNGTVYGDGVDDGTCIGCHSSGQGGFRSPWPLQ